MLSYFMDCINQVQFAKLIGITKGAVNRAIKRGSLVLNKNKKIDLKNKLSIRYMNIPRNGKSISYNGISSDDDISVRVIEKKDIYCILRKKISNRFFSRLSEFNEKYNVDYNINDFTFSIDEYISYLIFIIEKKNILNFFLNNDYEIHHINNLKDVNCLDFHSVNRSFHYINIDILSKEEHIERHS